MAETWRATAKAQRREQYLDAAAALFAERGFRGVSIDELGAAAGVSGPALYRHFSSKEDVLSQLLESASERLLAGCTATVAAAASPLQTLHDLIGFHVDFALSERDVIRVQDRELGNLPAAASHRVRSLQRQYVQAWIEVVQQLQPAASTAELELRAHAVFGLLNSTPYSARLGEVENARGILTEMAVDGLLGRHHETS